MLFLQPKYFLIDTGANEHRAAMSRAASGGKAACFALHLTFLLRAHDFRPPHSYFFSLILRSALVALYSHIRELTYLLHVLLAKYVKTNEDGDDRVWKRGRLIASV